MSTNTMSFALPEAMRSYVDQRVRSGQYGNTSEYLRELIRRVTGCPMQWLSLEADGHVDVVRLVGDRQDIVAILDAGD